MEQTPWQQVNIAYPGDTGQHREHQAVAHLSLVLPAAQAAGLIDQWWFIRKGPWRIRYLPSANLDSGQLAKIFGNDVSWTEHIYEPETHAFGGVDAMDAAHALFHHDSWHLLTYLTQHPADRRERSLLLCTALMRAAALDLNEQGDVWTKVLEYRTEQLSEATAPDPLTWRAFTSDVRRLLLGTPRTTSTWHTAFRTAGAGLQQLRETGALKRGLRAVIALHVIFHWNRIGIPAVSQARLAQAAKEAIFGHEPSSPETNRPALFSVGGNHPRGLASDSVDSSSLATTRP